MLRKLVCHPKDWPWSSWSFYEKGEGGLIAIDDLAGAGDPKRKSAPLKPKGAAPRFEEVSAASAAHVATSGAGMLWFRLRGIAICVWSGGAPSLGVLLPILVAVAVVDGVAPSHEPGAHTPALRVGIF